MSYDYSENILVQVNAEKYGLIRDGIPVNACYRN